jgi:hypothetical protein
LENLAKIRLQICPATYIFIQPLLSFLQPKIGQLETLVKVQGCKPGFGGVGGGGGGGA